jgi:DNA mismatch repair protein MutS
MSLQTPLMKQYYEIKSRHRDSILFFRMGDFYEMFGDDAVVASKVLQITLTTRDKGKKDQIPMCGFPHFAAEGYIKKLIRAGYKVAICEQVEDPKKASGIVKRDVVKVITPGTFLPEDQSENNYLMSFYQKNDLFGYAVADVSTGEFLVFESVNALEDELNRFRPGEIVLPKSLKNNPLIMEGLEHAFVTPFEDWHFDYIEAYRNLLRNFRVASLEGYGCEGMNTAISAAGALITYLEDSQRGNLDFKRIKVLKQNDYMVIDATSRRNLEIDRNLRDGTKEGSLLWAVDKTLTPMGGRLIRLWLHNPLINLEKIRQRQQAVRALYENPAVITQIKEALRNISDIERLTLKVTLGSAHARDLLSLKQSLESLPVIKKLMSDIDNIRINSLNNILNPLPEICSLIDKAITDDPPTTIKEGNIIKAGYHETVDELRNLTLSGKDYIASLEAREKQRTKIPSLKIGYNKVFGYYIEVAKSYLSQAPPEYIRKQTIKGAERFVVPDLKEYENKVLGAEEKVKNLEYEVFLEVRGEIAQEAEKLKNTAHALAELDVFISFSACAREFNYTMPTVTQDDVIHISEGRHLVVERMLTYEKFIPNDITLNFSNSMIAIITGPNMAGKSTFMRQTALIVLLAQTGSFVPASRAIIGLVDKIYTRIGASDFIAKGQSTFMVEMMETANILNNATNRSLIILDEIGRGTSTFDGISIAWAVVEYISKQIKARTLFATHYHELTELALVLDGIKNLNVVVREWGDEIVFLRKIEEGPADRSYGIQVARLAGIPKDIIKRSKEILANLENDELNSSSQPKLAHKRGKKKKNKDIQLNLFALPEERIKEEIMNLNVSDLTPEGALEKLQQMKKRLERQ